MRELVITEKFAGGRLDKTVFKYLDKASQGFVFKMLRKKNITLNDKKATGSEILNAGDSVKLYLSEETIAKFKSGLSVKDAKEKTKKSIRSDIPKAKLDVFCRTFVFDDDNLLAVNKPAGLLSQKAEDTDISANEYFQAVIPGNELFTPGVSNRLDRNTTGILIAGKNPAATRELNRAIAGRDVAKKYLCLVSGEVAGEKTIDGWLIKDEKHNKVAVIGKALTGASRIITSYRPLIVKAGLSLLEVDLVTGKSHQIRAHLASEGYPVIGDEKYGKPAVNEKFKEKYGLSFQLLHAYKLRFESMEGILEYMNGREIIAPVPQNFERILKEEGLWQPGVPGAFVVPSLKK